MWVLLQVLVVLVIVLAAITIFYLKGKDLTPFDQPNGQSFDTGKEPCEEHDAVVASLQISNQAISQLGAKQRLDIMRQNMDSISDGMEFSSSFTAVDAGGVRAEWVVAPGVDSSRRVLYLHGGAFMLGSPKSHRNITNKFSEAANAAVLAIDYRLMPEHHRKAGIEDCRTAYQWLLNNGPEGAGEASHVIVSGDSAGGNLTLSLLAWVRDNGLRQADAAVAISPTTDATYSSPSIHRNFNSDVMLGPIFKKVTKTPNFLVLWVSWLNQKINPSSPLVSPVFGDLSNLPPTLIHASEAEVLYDDAKRYVNRAVASGSPAVLQGWAHMVHVWHIYYPRLAETVEAWDEIEKFVAKHTADV